MRKLEISAFNIEEAKIKAFQEGITVVYDATAAWRKAGSPVLTKELSIFVADYLEKKNLFAFQGAGIIITINNGVEDTRKNSIFTLKSERRKGRCKLVRTIEIRAKSDDKLLGIAHTKMEALKLAKELIHEHRESIYAKTMYVSSDLDFEMEFIPTTKSKMGQYIVFSVDEGDVRLNKRKNRGFE